MMGMAQQATPTRPATAAEQRPIFTAVDNSCPVARGAYRVIAVAELAISLRRTDGARLLVLVAVQEAEYEVAS